MDGAGTGEMPEKGKEPTRTYLSPGYMAFVSGRCFLGSGKDLERTEGGLELLLLFFLAGQRCPKYHG